MPLQSIRANRSTALLVRRSRFVLRTKYKNGAVPDGFPIDQLATRPRPSSSSHVVMPSPGYNPLSPPQTHLLPKPKTRPTAPLMEFFAPSTLSPSESTPPRLATPGTFRPQGFSPSRRLTPRPNARSCFIPVSSLGFFTPSRGFPSPLGPAGSSPAELPSWRSPVAPPRLPPK
jgi:hypothetical protein